MRFLSHSCKVDLLIFCLALSPFVPARAADGPDPGPDPAIAKKLAKAEELFKKKNFPQAAAELEAANQLAKGQCGSCLLLLARAEVALGETERAIEASRAAVALGGPRPFAAAAYNQLGLLLLLQPLAGEAQLTEAEACLRRAVELGDSTALVNLAALQLRREHPGKTLALARRYLAAEPRGQSAEAAHILVCHARAVLAKGTPPESLAEVAVEPRAIASGVEPPKVLYRDFPPLDALRESGVVKLDSVIDEEGCVVTAKVLKPKETTLEERALQAARFWVFQPASYQGKPVRVAYQLVIDTREAYRWSGRGPGAGPADPLHNPYAFTFSPTDRGQIRDTGSYNLLMPH